MITRRQWEKNQKLLTDQRVNLSDGRGEHWKYKNFVQCGKCGRIYLAEKTRIKYEHRKINKKTKKKIPTGRITEHEYIQYHCTRGFYYANEKGSLIAKGIVEQDGVGNFYYKENSKIIYVTRKKCNTGCIQEVELGRLLSAEFSGIRFKTEIWNKIKDQLLAGKKRTLKLITEELQMLRSENTKNKARQEMLFEEKFEGAIKEDFFKEQMEKIDERQTEIKARIELLEEEEQGYDGQIRKALGAIDAIDNFGAKFKLADQKVKKQMVDFMCSKIFITGGEKISGTKEKVPYSLYVEWNDEFKDLYDVDLVALPKEIEAKYGLPKKVFTTSKNTHSL
jgi:hypothetical protein